jgi:hypothetical protein
MTRRYDLFSFAQAKARLAELADLEPALNLPSSAFDEAVRIAFEVTSTDWDNLSLAERISFRRDYLHEEYAAVSARLAYLEGLRQRHGITPSHNTMPSIDHSILSPSGHVSARARRAALARETAVLFPPGFWDRPQPSETQIQAQKIADLRRRAAMLRDLASRGMHPRRFPREAAMMESEADQLEAEKL